MSNDETAYGSAVNWQNCCCKPKGIVLREELMSRYLCVAFVSLVVQPSNLLGAPIQLIEGLPSSYKPGDPVTFDVRLPAMGNLGSYNLELALESPVGTAGVDFYFDVAATVPAPTNYVFPSAASFFDAANVDSPSRHRLTLTDFDFGGVDVIPGTNDRVATVVFQTAATFAGKLALSVDTDGLILDTPDVDPTPVVGFDMLKSDIAASGAIAIVPVQEPSTALLAGAVILGAWLWRASLGKS